MQYSICFMTREGMYGAIHPEPKEVPGGRVQGNSRGLRLHFSENTDISNYKKNIPIILAPQEENTEIVDLPYCPCSRG